MYIRYICNNKCQAFLWFIYFLPILRQICVWKSRYIIHEICRNSYFRALKTQNFRRPPTMVANILLYHFSPPTLLKWRHRAWFIFSHYFKIKLRKMNMNVLSLGDINKVLVSKSILSTLPWQIFATNRINCLNYSCNL